MSIVVYPDNDELSASRTTSIITSGAHTGSGQTKGTRMARLRVSFTGLIITLLCASAIHPSAAFALEDHTRDGWMVGFSLGAGPGKFKDAPSGTESTSETGGVFALRVGRMVHPSLLVNAELAGWNRTTKASRFGQSIESSFTFSTWHWLAPTTQRIRQQRSVDCTCAAGSLLLRSKTKSRRTARP